jgi:hypothetical protein
MREEHGMGHLLGAGLPESDERGCDGAQGDGHGQPVEECAFVGEERLGLDARDLGGRIDRKAAVAHIVSRRHCTELL